MSLSSTPVVVVEFNNTARLYSMMRFCRAISLSTYSTCSINGWYLIHYIRRDGLDVVFCFSGLFEMFIPLNWKQEHGQTLEKKKGGQPHGPWLLITLKAEDKTKYVPKTIEKRKCLCAACHWLLLNILTVFTAQFWSSDTAQMYWNTVCLHLRCCCHLNSLEVESCPSWHHSCCACRLHLQKPFSCWGSTWRAV